MSECLSFHPGLPSFFLEAAAVSSERLCYLGPRPPTVRPPARARPSVLYLRLTGCLSPSCRDGLNATSSSPPLSFPPPSLSFYSPFLSLSPPLSLSLSSVQPLKTEASPCDPPETTAAVAAAAAAARGREAVLGLNRSRPLRLGNQCIGNGNENENTSRLCLSVWLVSPSLPPSLWHPKSQQKRIGSGIFVGRLSFSFASFGLFSLLRAENATKCGRQQFSNGSLPPSFLPSGGPLSLPKPVTFTSVHAADFRRSMGPIPSPARSAFQRRQNASILMYFRCRLLPSFRGFQPLAVSAPPFALSD